MVGGGRIRGWSVGRSLDIARSLEGSFIMLSQFHGLFERMAVTL
jgi:hypothetical protein